MTEKVHYAGNDSARLTYRKILRLLPGHVNKDVLPGNSRPKSKKIKAVLKFCHMERIKYLVDKQNSAQNYDSGLISLGKGHERLKSAK